MKLLQKIMCFVVIATILLSVVCFSASADYKHSGYPNYDVWNAFPEFDFTFCSDSRTNSSPLLYSSRVYSVVNDVSSLIYGGYEFYPDIPVDDSLGVTTYNNDDVGCYSNLATTSSSIFGTYITASSDTSISSANKRISPLTQYRRMAMDANNTVSPTESQVISRVSDIARVGHFFDVKILGDLSVIRDDYEFTLSVFYPILSGDIDDVSTLDNRWLDLDSTYGYVSLRVMYDYLSVTDSGTEWVSVDTDNIVYMGSLGSLDFKSIVAFGDNDTFHSAFGYGRVLEHNTLIDFSEAPLLSNPNNPDELFRVVKNISFEPTFYINRDLYNNDPQFDLDPIDSGDYILSCLQRYNLPGDNVSHFGTGYPVQDICFYTTDNYFMTSRWADNIVSDLFKEYNETVSLNDFSFVTWLGNTLGGVFNVNLFGGISLGSIVYMVLGIGFLYIVIKFFAGG